MARHWRQRFDMLATTKVLQEWLPEDVVEAVMESQEASFPHSQSVRSRTSSDMSKR